MKMKLKAVASSLLVAALLMTGCSGGNTPAPQASAAPAAPAASADPAASAAPAAPAAPADEAKPGGELVVGLTGDPYNLAPWTTNDMNSSLVMNPVLPRLMEIDETGKKVPYLIKDYSISDDATEYVVEIFDGITWHDGTPLTTDDLEFTATYIPQNKLSYGADMYAPVKSMEKLSKTKIKYTLDAPRVNFLSQVGYWVPIMPKHIYESVTDPMNFDYPAIGYGPYKVKEFKKGEYYTLEKVPNWPLANDGQGAYLDKITFRVFPDANALILAIKNGEVHSSASAIPVAAQQQLLAEPDKFDVLRVPSLGFGYFSFSYKNELLKEQVVRQAIAMTVDRDALVNIAMEGGAIKMETPISPVYTDMVKSDIKFPAFDIEGAKALLDGAGYKEVNGVRVSPSGKPLEFELLYRTTTANIDSIANIFAANCAKAGIKINLQSVEPATYTQRVTQNHDYDINAIDWGVIDDVDSSLGTIYLSNAVLNFMEYKNDKIDELIKASEGEPSYEKRIELMDEFQREFIKEIPSINSWVRINSYGVSKQFGGWDLKPGLYGVVNCGQIVKVYKK